jgi:hypothetical protein
MLKKARLLTRPTPARRDATCPSKAASSYHLIRGGWDDPNCARPTRGVRDRALREHGDRPSHPAPFQHPANLSPFVFQRLTDSH